ncbi:MAG: RDD family protein [Thermoguttaceae bacterium]
MSNDDRYVLETPENIEVEFEPAGLGTRFCAMLIDTLWIGLLLLLLFLLLIGFGAGVSELLDGRRGRQWVDWVAAVLWAIAAVLLYDGYFILFELLLRGQTPGKRSMKIRVVRDDGTPVGANEVLIRNLLRIVDFLPAGYALGAIVMFPSPLAKRLGDIAAGTIVVKEGQRDYRGRTDKKYEIASSSIGPVNTELQPEERRMVVGFLQRRFELLPGARQQLAERLAKPLHEKYGGQYTDAESYIQRLVEGRHYES